MNCPKCNSEMRDVAPPPGATGADWHCPDCGDWTEETMEIERARTIISQAYQFAAAAGVNADVLDNLSAASAGEPLPHPDAEWDVGEWTWQGCGHEAQAVCGECRVHDAADVGRLAWRVAELENALEARAPDDPALAQVGDDPQGVGEHVRVAAQELRGLVARYRTALEENRLAAGQVLAIVDRGRTPRHEWVITKLRRIKDLTGKALDGGDE